MHFIEQLKEKPSHVKSRIAFFTAVSFTGVIALIWLSTIPARFHNMETFTPKQVEEQKAAVSNTLDEIITGAKKGLDTAQVKEETPPPTRFDNNSALRDLSGWSATATDTSPTTDETPPVQKTTVAPTSQSAPTPIQPPAVPKTSTSIGGKETIGAKGDPKTSVILIGTSTKKSE